MAMTPQDEQVARRAIAAMKAAAKQAGDDVAFLAVCRQLREKEAEVVELKRRLALAMWEICWSWPAYTALKPPWTRERWVLPYRAAVRQAQREAERG